MGFPRQEYWSGLPFPSPGDLPNPGSNPCLLHWQADSLSLGHQGSTIKYICKYWVGQIVHSGFSITSYGKNWMNFLAKPIFCSLWSEVKNKMPQVSLARWAWCGEWGGNVSVSNVFEDAGMIKRKGLARESFAQDRGGAPERKGQNYPQKEMHKPVDSITLGHETFQAGNSHYLSWLLISVCGRSLALEAAESICSQLHERTCLPEDPGCSS